MPGDHGTGASWDEEAGDDPAVESEDARHVSEVESGQEGFVDTLMVTAMNPAGSVSVTALLDGRVFRVQLSPEVVGMTEEHLAEEIGVIATVARKQAMAAQHAFAANMLHQLGHDRVSTRVYLEHDIGLPSPLTVLKEKSEIFASRYSDES